MRLTSWVAALAVVGLALVLAAVGGGGSGSLGGTTPASAIGNGFFFNNSVSHKLVRARPVTFATSKKLGSDFAVTVGTWSVATDEEIPEYLKEWPDYGQPGFAVYKIDMKGALASTSGDIPSTLIDGTQYILD